MIEMPSWVWTGPKELCIKRRPGSRTRENGLFGDLHVHIETKGSCIEATRTYN